jgi:hypothetical protein
MSTNKKFTEEELVEQVSNWIDANVELLQTAQILSKKIAFLGLINNFRPLPFELLPKEENGYDLVVYMDHPLKSYEFYVKQEDKILLDDNEMTRDECINLIVDTHDETAKIYSKFSLSVQSRNYTEINQMISHELKLYRAFIEPELKAVKKKLQDTPECGLTNPSDGSVSYLNRVMGRWDLALLWETCPFVVVKNPEETAKVQELVNEFKNAEEKKSALLKAMEKLCLMSGMDVEVRTDSKDTEMDASGWLNFDETGLPKIGPVIHAVKIAVYSKFEGNVRKEAGSSSKLLIK